tara:strand:- start:1522 stop:1803 length:282 start_codon:yes stop_codon:yes gene_type:complete
MITLKRILDTQIEKDLVKEIIDEIRHAEDPGKYLDGIESVDYLLIMRSEIEETKNMSDGSKRYYRSLISNRIDSLTNPENYRSLINEQKEMFN